MMAVAVAVRSGRPPSEILSTWSSRDLVQWMAYDRLYQQHQAATVGLGMLGGASDSATHVQHVSSLSELMG